MANRKVRVAVNGYGTIGKRVADAVARQDDMELVGVADVAHDYRVKVALLREYPVYGADSSALKEMRANGIDARGQLKDLLSLSEVVVDCTPRGVGAKNLSIYQRAGIKVIFQGGEDHDLTGFSFVAQANYREALNRGSLRVVSSSTTGIVRVMGALKKWGLLKEARVVVFRGGVDPAATHIRGQISNFIPEQAVPSHQGPDSQKIIPDLPIVTMAGTGSLAFGHLHYAMVSTNWAVTKKEVIDSLVAAPRISFVRFERGISSANNIAELMNDLLRPRAEMWEVAIWEDGISTDRDEVYFTYMVDNDAIVIPENIDAIRAISGLQEDGAVSIAMTDVSLGVTKSFLPDNA